MLFYIESYTDMTQRVKIDSTVSPPKPKYQPACPLFSAIPVEIRFMIYRHLLKSPEPIDNVHKQLGAKDTALVDNYHPIPCVDAAILRTCRLTYLEALPVLYGQNTFIFSSSSAIRSFQSKSIMGYPLGKRFPVTILTLLSTRFNGVNIC